MAILSVVYGKVLVIVGLVFPMTQVIAKEVPADYFQFFYIYLFAGCLSFHVYFNLEIFFTKIKLKWERSKNAKRAAELSGLNNEQESFKVPRPVNCYGSFYLRIGQVCESIIL